MGNYILKSRDGDWRYMTPKQREQKEKLLDDSGYPRLLYPMQYFEKRNAGRPYPIEDGFNKPHPWIKFYIDEYDAYEMENMIAMDTWRTNNPKLSKMEINLHMFYFQ